MKKSYILAAALAVAACAPLTSHATVLVDGEVGYGYQSIGDGMHTVHVDVDFLNSYVVGLEHREWNNRGGENDLYAKYKTGPFAVGIGTRGYYDRDSKLFALLEAETNLHGPIDAYANLLFSKDELAYKLGLQYDLDHKGLEVDVNYTYMDRDGTPHEDGLGIGVNYHF